MKLVRAHGIKVTFKNITQESTRWINWTRNYWDITNVDLNEPGRFTYHCCSWMTWKWIETGALNTVPDMSPIKFLAPDCMLKLFADDCDWEVVKQFRGSGALIAALSTSSSLLLPGIALMLSGSTDFLLLSRWSIAHMDFCWSTLAVVYGAKPCTVLWPLSWRISSESTPFSNNCVHMDLRIEWLVYLPTNPARLAIRDIICPIRFIPIGCGMNHLDWGDGRL